MTKFYGKLHQVSLVASQVAVRPATTGKFSQLMVAYSYCVSKPVYNLQVGLVVLKAYIITHPSPLPVAFSFCMFLRVSTPDYDKALLYLQSDNQSFEFEWRELLGRGYYGECYKVHICKDNVPACVKVSDKP